MISHILIPRSTNHAHVSDEDLQLIYGMKRNFQINWIHHIVNTMVKAKKSTTYQFPYVVLVSRFIDYSNVDVTHEMKDDTMVDCEIVTKHLTKLGLVRHGEELLMNFDIPRQLAPAPLAPTRRAPPTSARVAPWAPPPPTASSSQPPHTSREEEAQEQPVYVDASPFHVLIMEKLEHILGQQGRLARDLEEIKETMYALDARVVGIKAKLQVCDIPFNMDEEDVHEDGVTHNEGKANFEDARAEIATSDAQEVVAPMEEVQDDSAIITANIEKVVADIVMEHGDDGDSQA